MQGEKRLVQGHPRDSSLPPPQEHLYTAGDYLTHICPSHWFLTSRGVCFTAHNTPAPAQCPPWNRSSIKFVKEGQDETS